MQRQPYCSICGKTGKIDLHHVKPRSQGGKDTDDNLVALCRECHTRHHSEEHIDFVLVDGGWYANGEKMHVYNEFNQDAPQTTEDVLGSLAGDLRELKCTADQVDYFLSKEIAEANRKLNGDRRSLADWIVDNLSVSPRSVDSYLTKRLAYATLPDEAKDLGITNGYRVYLLVQRGHALRDLLQDFRTMGRSHFDTKYGLKTIKEKHVCPDCGQVHSMKEG